MSPIIVTAAIAGLRALRSIDTHVVTRLDAIVTASGMDEARVAAAVALGEALPEARHAAQAVATRAFTPPRQTLWSSPPPSASPALAVALGRSLLALGVPNAAALIQQRAASSPEVERRHLLALLTVTGA